MSVGVCVLSAIPDAEAAVVSTWDLLIAIVAATCSVLDRALPESHPQAQLGKEGKRGTGVLLADLDLKEDPAAEPF